MSTPTPRDLTKWDILHLLEETDSELPPGEPIDLTVGGGSAVIFWWEHRGTTDVDVISTIDLPEELVKAVQRVAQKHDLPSDWLNVNAAYAMMPTLPLKQERMFIGKNRLRVFIPNHRYMLAMKLFAGRDRDMDDAVRLMRRVGMTTKEELYDLIKESYPRGIFPAINFDFIDEVASEVNSEA